MPGDLLDPFYPQQQAVVGHSAEGLIEKRDEGLIRPRYGQAH